MGRALGAIGAAAALFACADRRVEVELPASGSARSAILAYEATGPGGSFVLERLIAVDLESSATADLLDLPGWDEAGSLRFTTAFYDTTLDELAIEPGTIALAREGRLRAVPPSERIEQRVLSSSTAGEWRAIARLPPPVAAARFSGEALAELLCDTFDARAIRVQTGTELPDGAFAVELPEGVLAGDQGGTMHLIQKDGTFRTITSTSVLWDAMPDPRAPSSSVLFASASGEIFTGRLAGDALELTLHAWSPDAGGIFWMDAGVAGGRLEILTLSRTGTFGRYRDGAFTVLAAFRSEPALGGRGGVRWLGPGRGVAVYWTSSEIAMLEGDNLRYVSPATDGRAFTTVNVIPGVGIVASTDIGQLFAGDGRTFTEIGDWGFGSPFEITTILPYRTGMLVVGRNSLFGQFEPRYGFCEIENVALGTTLDMIPWDDDFLLVTESTPGTTERLVTIVSPRPR